MIKIIISIVFATGSCLISGKTTTVKVFHVFENFGEETQELKNSIVMNYEPTGFLSDSTVYSHTIPLDKKYVYVSGKNEGLKLMRTFKKKKFYPTSLRMIRMVIASALLFMGLTTVYIGKNIRNLMIMEILSNESGIIH